MGRKTTQYIVLGALLLTIALVLIYQFRRGESPSEPVETPVPAAAPQRGATQAKRGAGASAVPDVNLAALKQTPPEPETTARNPFRLKPPPPPPPPPQGRAGMAGADTAQPPGPPPPPPIMLKFIGLVNPGGGAARIAILTSGPDVFYGREGDIIDGRYKIVSIGAESVVVSYADGRGTRRIALSGS